MCQLDTTSTDDRVHQQKKHDQMLTLSFRFDMKMNLLFAAYLSEVKRSRQSNDFINSTSVFQHTAAHCTNVKANRKQTKKTNFFKVSMSKALVLY